MLGHDFSMLREGSPGSVRATASVCCLRRRREVGAWLRLGQRLEPPGNRRKASAKAGQTSGRTAAGHEPPWRSEVTANSRRAMRRRNGSRAPWCACAKHNPVLLRVSYLSLLAFYMAKRSSRTFFRLHLLISKNIYIRIKW